MTKKTFKILGMDCDACAKMIELDMEDAGIKASCSYAKQILEVELENDLNEDQIKNIVSKSGYELVTN